MGKTEIYRSILLDPYGVDPYQTRMTNFAQDKKEVGIKKEEPKEVKVSSNIDTFISDEDPEIQALRDFRTLIG